MCSQFSRKRGIQYDDAMLATMMPMITAKHTPFDTLSQHANTSFSPIKIRTAAMPYLSIWKVRVKDSMTKYSDRRLSMAKAEDEQFRNTSLTEASFDATESTAKTKSTTQTATTTSSSSEAFRRSLAGLLKTSKESLPVRNHSEPWPDVRTWLFAPLRLGSRRLLPSNDSRRGKTPPASWILLSSNSTLVDRGGRHSTSATVMKKCPWGS
mmetsp:Transcript_27029/g.56113  ORF Transcript_27029/g.56113 Transcript_27029/m.56113 type:complete len:210 (+) Transcript_27029:333-962(+)